MKKLFTSFIALTALLSFQKVNAQVDTIIYEGFDDTTHYEFIVIAPPNVNDTTWIDFDADGIPDGSTQGTRPGEWFINYGFADADSTTLVMASNSWTNDASTPIQNFLITPPITLSANNGMLYWKSASFQTPRYLDGYKVLISTTGNDISMFTDTVSIYAEYISSTAGPGDSSFATYTFSPGFVAGMDGQYVEWNNDSARYRCQLRPDSVSLATYAGETIYIAFVADSHDDNLLSIDDILVTGTGKTSAIPGSPTFDPTSSIRENEGSLNALLVNPNPATDNFTLNFSVKQADVYQVVIHDLMGNLVYQKDLGMQSVGLKYNNISTESLSAGHYTVSLQSSQKVAKSKLTVVK